MSRTLISRPNVEKLVRMADLDLRVTTNAQRDALIDGLMKTVQLAGNVSTNLYMISYRDPNPDKAQKVVQSLLTIFVESSLGDKRQDTRAAVKFLDDQIKRYEESLQAAENRLKDFRLKYMGVPGQGGGQDYFAGSRSSPTTSRPRGSSCALPSSRATPTSATSPARRRRSCRSRAAPLRRSPSPRSMRASQRRRPISTSSCGHSPTSTRTSSARGA